MTNVEALKNLYVAFGGNLTDVYEDIKIGVPVSDYTTSADVINAIATHVGTGGAAELPAVTTSD